MDEDMKRGIDEVLEAVKDPESGLSVADLGLVSRLRYNREKNELYVFVDYKSRISRCPACAGIASVVVSGISRELIAAFGEKFPGIEAQIIE